MGTRPLLHKVQTVAVGVEDLTDSLRDMRINVEILARGHEHLATAIQSVAGAVSKGFMEVLDVLQRIASDREDGAGGSAGASQLAQLMARIGAVKQTFRLRLSDRTVSATASADVYLSTGRTWVELVDIAEQILGVEREEALNWLLQTVKLPGRRDPNVLVSMRVCVPTLRVKPHMVQLWKQEVVTAFVSGISIPLEDVTDDLANLWLNDETYIRSEVGKPCLVDGLARMLRLAGGASIVSEPANVGGRPVVRCTLGHVALASCFVRWRAAPRVTHAAAVLSVRGSSTSGRPSWPASTTSYLWTTRCMMVCRSLTVTMSIVALWTSAALGTPRTLTPTRAWPEPPPVSVRAPRMGPPRLVRVLLRATL